MPFIVVDAKKEIEKKKQEDLSFAQAWEESREEYRKIYSNNAKDRENRRKGTVIMEEKILRLLESIDVKLGDVCQEVHSIDNRIDSLESRFYNLERILDGFKLMSEETRESISEQRNSVREIHTLIENEIRFNLKTIVENNSREKLSAKRVDSKIAELERRQLVSKLRECELKASELLAKLT